MLPGLEVALLTMKEGELARICFTYEYGYGEIGLPQYGIIHLICYKLIHLISQYFLHYCFSEPSQNFYSTESDPHLRSRIDFDRALGSQCKARARRTKRNYC